MGNAASSDAHGQSKESGKDTGKHSSNGGHTQPRKHPAKAPPPPVAALVSSPAASIVTSTEQASASPNHSRPRSATPIQSHLPPLDDMGQADSKQRPVSRANSKRAPPAAAPSQKDSPQAASSPVTKPVDVQPPAVTENSQQDVSFPSAPPYSLPPVASYSRPPRLPLPIEEEVHAPGSPIITPQDAGAELEHHDIDSAILPRKSSVLSSTTVDDDDIGDNEGFPPDVGHSLQLKIPTRMEWNGSGDKVFVTGTFCNWERKMKLHKNKDKTGFSATVMLPPGTHHIKFLVDGEMVTSNDLPTTVDWTNILVNYVEIVAPLPPDEEDSKQPPAPAAPMPIPGAAITRGQAEADGEGLARPLPLRTNDDGSDIIGDDDSIGPRGERASDATQKGIPVPPSSTTDSASVKDGSEAATKTKAAAKPKQPRPKYTTEIPEFLLDLDNYGEPENERFQRAQRAAGDLPPPPSLPMFLNKSILNGNTPHKDDASVLIMPNHTVLNHLATSSIKSGVLATSGTTRYKRKFLTTIMYKPTSDDG
ncbi:unnamed protein product [Zymoseptoria tritici ST99CH_3D1]|nr:unnamed protein product [Zymoseptoria tritici ST99CH_3D1]